MSRSGYSDDCEDLNLYRGAVERAMAGKRGQKAFRDIVSALDAMPEKVLISASFSRGDDMCTLGALAHKRGVDMSDLEQPESDPEYAEWVDSHAVGFRLDIAPSMAAEVMYMNDEHHGSYDSSPEQRWERMRKWAVSKLKTEATP